MLIGQTMTGKSATLQIFNTYFNSIGNQSCHLHILNPKSMPIEALFGNLDINTKEWAEGVLGEIFRRCSHS